MEATEYGKQVSALVELKALTRKATLAGLNAGTGGRSWFMAL
jgi:hypothetical protein